MDSYYSFDGMFFAPYGRKASAEPATKIAGAARQLPTRGAADVRLRAVFGGRAEVVRNDAPVFYRMNRAAWLAAYTALNNSFQKTLVFRLGVDSGYFSEYNNMILAMLYCLKNQIKFVLYSDHAHFALRDGWNDFFRPFPAVNTDYIHKDYNVRPYIIVNNTEPELQKIIKYRYILTAYKALRGITYVTQDLWDQHYDPAFAEERFTVPELGFYDAPLLEVTRVFIEALWRYNAQSAPVIADFVRAAGVPDDYVSLHIRAGDKFTEAKVYDFTEYMAVAQEVSHNRQAFVLTDDYCVIEQLREQYPDWQFYTLCEPTERGYFHRDFVKQDKLYKYRQHLKLFANMDICAASSSFIGTYSSNPGMYMGMRIGQERCHCLDFEEWVVW